MKLYLKVHQSSILEVLTEKISNDLIEIEANNFEEFEKEVINEYEYDEEVEEQLKELLENDLEPMDTNTYNIKHWVSNRSFGELIDMYESGEIIKPEMQRNFVWDSMKSSRLIESIIMGLPIPPLFLLEIGKNKYEIIDGLQRLTTVYNYVLGKPWHNDQSKKRKIVSKLSTKVLKEIGGRSFEDLDPDYQRIIKRTTVPLIEFSQIEPFNVDSKYLIFERINTGSEKLNSMQIRKSLAHGMFMKDLYMSSELNSTFLNYFSSGNIKKDNHVEAYLRVIAMSKLTYGDFNTDKGGIKSILNEYCEKRRTSSISQSYHKQFDAAIEYTSKVFSTDKTAFRRVEKDSKGNYIFSGNLNISILVAFIGTVISNSDKVDSNHVDVYNRYCTTMNQVIQDTFEKKRENPFTTSTGSLTAIEERFQLMKEILVD